MRFLNISSFFCLYNRSRPMFLNGAAIKLKPNLITINRFLFTSPQCLINRLDLKFLKMSKDNSRNPDGAYGIPGNRKEKNINNLLRQGKTPRTDAMSVWVLKTGANGGSKSVLLQTDQKHYLFNCGEGVQRAIYFGKVHIDDIFITHKSWSNIGGLYGLLLTRAVANKQRGSQAALNVHGPPHVEQILSMAKQFQDTRTVFGDVEKYEIGNSSYSNYQVDIEYVKISNTSEEVNSAKENSSLENSDISTNLDKADTNFSVAYIVTPKTGIMCWKVDLPKLLKLNVSPGLWVQELLKGNPYTLEDGSVITREEYCFPPPHVPPIVILECPSEGHLKSLLSNEKLLNLATAGDGAPQLIVHMTPGKIVDREDYQEFMKRFSTTQHMILNERSRDSVPEASVAFQQALNNLHPDIFPDLHSCKTLKAYEEPQNSMIVQADVGLRYNLKPFSKKCEPGLDWSKCVTLDHEESIEKLFKDAQKGAKETVQAWKEEIKNMPVVQNRREYPEVVFLGTASSKPGKTRNVSGILLHLSPDKCMLLDCGESTTEQLQAVYGDRSDSILANLVAIFVSHVHADHHMGLFGVVNARTQACETLGKPMKRLLVLAPILIQRWIQLYMRTVKNLFSEIQLVRHVADFQETSALASVHKTILDELDLQEYTPIPVNHVPHSYGVSITHQSGWKLCYSGDTTPCQRLVEGGKGCDLLIHEATFSGHLLHEALAKNHSTMPQAIKIGQQMEAKFIMLTHFSQRYSYMPLLPEDLPDNVVIAFDYMKVTLDDLPTLAKLIPVLKEVFSGRLYNRKLQEISKSKLQVVLEEIEYFNSKRKRDKDENKGNDSESSGDRKKQLLEADNEPRASGSGYEETAVGHGEKMNQSQSMKKNIYEANVGNETHTRKDKIADIGGFEMDMTDIGSCPMEYTAQTFNQLENLMSDDATKRNVAIGLKTEESGETDLELGVHVESGEEIKTQEQSGTSIDFAETLIESGVVSGTGLDLAKTTEDLGLQTKGFMITVNQKQIQELDDIKENDTADNSESDIDSLQEFKVKLKE